MRYKLIKLHKFSGDKASIYTILQDGEKESFLDKFVKENQISFKDEIIDILKRLISIGHKTGGRESFFKTFEGNPGDGVCAIYDDEQSKLRLYCIRYGTQLVVVGNGGPKEKTIRSFQSDEKLKEENYFLRWLSGEITNRIKDKDITFINDHLDFSGNLVFQDNEKE